MSCQPPSSLVWSCFGGLDILPRERCHGALSRAANEVGVSVKQVEREWVMSLRWVTIRAGNMPSWNDNLRSNFGFRLFKGSLDRNPAPR